jgi:hypothetical protein
VLVNGKKQLHYQSSLSNSRSRFNQFWQFWHNYQLHLMLVLLTISLILGYIGFWKYTRAIGTSHSETDILYLTLQLTTLESGSVSGPLSWELEVARILVPFFTAYTAVMAVGIFFRKQLQLVRLRYLRDHIIICGLGEKGVMLASSLRQRGFNIVAVEIDKNNPNIDLCVENGVIVLEGDATESAILRKTATHRASHLVSVCGDDGINAEVAILARQLNAIRKHGTLNCRIHIINHELCELLREFEFGSVTFPQFRLEMFNIYESGARIMLQDYSPFNGETNSNPKGTHILVVGLGRLGQNLVIQAAREWYKRNQGSHAPLRISLLDKNAKEKASYLNNRYPRLPTCCELIPYSMDLGTNEFNLASDLFISQGQINLDLIYICLNDHTLALQSALKLRQHLQCNQPPIIVRLDENSGLAKLLTGKDAAANYSQNIIPFGLLKRVCRADLILGGTHEILAQAFHEDYVRHRLGDGLKLGQKRSLISWDQLPEDLRESNRRQVDHIRLKLQAAGYIIQPLVDWDAANFKFKPDSLDLIAKMEHEHWVQERQRNGWKYADGPEDTMNKTHPDMLPWDQISEPVRDKDRQQVIELPRLLAEAGFQVVKLNE